MAQHPKKPCDICGEDAAKVKPVTLFVGRKRYARWRMCRACRAAAFIRLGASPGWLTSSSSFWQNLSAPPKRGPA